MLKQLYFNDVENIEKPQQKWCEYRTWRQIHC